jgi:hypothetical protein
VPPPAPACRRPRRWEPCSSGLLAGVGMPVSPILLCDMLCSRKQEHQAHTPTGPSRHRSTGIRLIRNRLPLLSSLRRTICIPQFFSVGSERRTMACATVAFQGARLVQGRTAPRSARRSVVVNAADRSLWLPGGCHDARKDAILAQGCTQTRMMARWWFGGWGLCLALAAAHPGCPVALRAGIVAPKHLDGKLAGGE